ncbi:5-methyltetrahydropteroyltriglutamate--homocysteine S-methyltransferase [Agaribacter marinus]|uniref:5-methyltetrahydropteroyltriglutamate--homocysteine methyltransferase n=1 Tax=Virgibacillus salarius TaxID=447199 RepID=A0A941DRS9_9BACI|nr:5-methyltetrahydropteroyltriglutamate--homocysteine S-methyltransferase [Virgibacillus salarius]MBR7795894.1 5-methyltetrahydropteroyltriglutamate--homocysteine S-methyltransferase [Virgibacillus salarius]NAZ08606.1 5-methyltetrahydropteroyltriglutamate--homocysteine S-methyltransferase [Agaribacter marinus]WBX78569.1 5-methyltetrahydropteroyltriglutamate--homocysteine S-methyltransferase [Virgibacillus salarius]
MTFTAISSNLGYPRIGEKREWKRALESFWKEEITKEQLIKETDKIRLKNLKKQQELGIDLIPVGDFSFYDHVLDTSAMFGVIPERFSYNGGKVDLETYFAIARGTKDAVASEITKWFNTNYHYIVPELEHAQPILTENRPLAFYKEAKEELGIDGKPVILGPITYLSLAKGYKEEEFDELLDVFVPLYLQILEELESAGATWVQIDEPIFGTKLDDAVIQKAKKVYTQFCEAAPKLKLILQTYFEHVINYESIIEFPVAAIGLDFVHGDSLQLIKQFGFPKDKVLAAGIINGRNVWQENIADKLSIIEEIKSITTIQDIILQPSSSLLHVPVTKKLEVDLNPDIKAGLSFADEKLEDITTLTKGCNDGEHSIATKIKTNQEQLARFNSSALRTNDQVRKELQSLDTSDAKRPLPFNQRIKKQQHELKLPLLPTTTIGSLPQTPVVRKTRTKWRKGEISNEKYEQFIKDNIDKWITIQEELELDVLVHGEFERTDMVEYFGEKLNGFEVTAFGWVQSYGSRCVKPPLIFGDVSFNKAMTVKESVYAQSLTEKPVKGMLTGPVTILNWSFVHDDAPRFTIQNQIALALRKELEALEENGIQIIQVDEPALREGLPLDERKWEDYLEAAVYAFGLATSAVKDSTQIHTHMCYSEFHDIYETIDALDADVISIETSRSHGEMVTTFEENTYEKEIGLGVYDIHSPRIPAKSEIIQNINRALQTIPPKQFWINPDCGLKTRNEEETIGALKIMVEAAADIRKEHLSYQKY